jgi:hypothetical protein
MKRASAVPILESDAEVWNLPRAAAALNLSTWTTREYILSGAIPALRLPCPLNPRRHLRRMLVAKRDVLAFIERHREGGVR